MTLAFHQYRFAILGFIAVIAFSISISKTYAMTGELIIEQVSSGNQLSQWILTTPNRTTISNNTADSGKAIILTETGSYALVITPPRQAFSTITLYEGRRVLQSVNGERMTFRAGPTSDLRIVISYEFFGRIRVESDPTGRRFTILGGDTVKFTGITPATFNNAPPLYYTIQFEHMSGCIAPHDQKRVLPANQTLVFNGIYRCDSPLSTGSTLPTPDGVQEDSVRLHLTSSQSEVVPGGNITYTLRVENRSRSTLERSTLTVQFDSSKILFDNLPSGGHVEGNLLVFDIEKIFATRTWTAEITGKVHPTLTVRDEIDLSARIFGQGIVEGGGSERYLSVQHTIGIAYLPATGMDVSSMFSLFVSLSALLLTVILSRKNSFMKSIALQR